MGNAAGDRGYSRVWAKCQSVQKCGRRGERLYNFNSSESCFGAVTGALQVKFSQT